MLIFLLPLLVMWRLCASEICMPYSWSRIYDDVDGRNFPVEVNPGRGLGSFYVCGDSDKDMVIMSFGHGITYFNMWCKGSTLVDVTQGCPCVVEPTTGYVFNAPLSSSVGGLGVVTPTGQSVNPPRFSRVNSRKPKTFCDYCVGETSFSAKMRLCAYDEGGFFFVSVKCVYKDRNNIVVSWGEEMPCGRIKAESFDECKFSHTCFHINPHSSEGTEAQ